MLRELPHATFQAFSILPYWGTRKERFQKIIFAQHLLCPHAKAFVPTGQHAFSYREEGEDVQGAAACSLTSFLYPSVEEHGSTRFQKIVFLHSICSKSLCANKRGSFSINANSHIYSEMALGGENAAGADNYPHNTPRQTAHTWVQNEPQTPHQGKMAILCCHDSVFRKY